MNNSYAGNEFFFSHVACEIYYLEIHMEIFVLTINSKTTTICHKSSLPLSNPPGAIPPIKLQSFPMEKSAFTHGTAQIFRQGSIFSYLRGILTCVVATRGTAGTLLTLLFRVLMKILGT